MRMIGRGAVLLLMMVAAACTKQTTTNITSENTLVSDEISDGNSAQFDNLSATGGLEGNSTAPSNTN